MAQFFSVINKASGNTGFLSVPELGFVIKEHHVCKLLDFLGMLPEGEFFAKEITEEAYYANVNEKELKDYAYV